MKTIKPIPFVPQPATLAGPRIVRIDPPTKVDYKIGKDVPCPTDIIPMEAYDCRKRPVTGGRGCLKKAV